jgi:hypothetical protein
MEESTVVKRLLEDDEHPEMCTSVFDRATALPSVEVALLAKNNPSTSDSIWQHDNRNATTIQMYSTLV